MSAQAVPPRSYRRRLNALALLVGAGFLVFMVFQLDAGEVATRVGQVGAWAAAAFSTYVAGQVVAAAAWRQSLEPSRTRAGYLDVLRAIWAGHALNAVTPGGAAGELLKGTLLAGKIDSDELVASLLQLNVLTAMVVSSFGVLGSLVCLPWLDVPMAVILGTLAAAMLAWVAVFGLYLLVHRQATTSLVRWAQAIPGLRTVDPLPRSTRATAIDRRLRALRENRPAAFRRVVLWLAMGRLLQIAEVWLLLRGMIPESSAGYLLLLSILAQTASQLVAWLGAIVPAQVGVIEGGSAAFFQLAGLDPVTGLSMELLRRVRKLLGIAIGLCLGMWAARHAAAFRRMAHPTPVLSDGGTAKRRSLALYRNPEPHFSCVPTEAKADREGSLRSQDTGKA